MAEAILASVGGVAGDVVDAVIRLRAVEDGGDDVAVRRALSPCLPYKGLLALGEADEGVFFGRRELVEQVTERLTRTHFAALVGASGSGKSSVLRAGVANALRSAGRPSTVVTPSERDVVRAVAAGTISADTLIIDQFEEFFTLWGETDRNAVIEGLFSALSFGPLGALAIGIRSDFFGQCADHVGLVSRLADATVLVGVLDEHELLAMIVGPAAASGLILDSGFASMIVSDLGDERHPLPLLSHTLFETWRRRHTRGVSRSTTITTPGAFGVRSPGPPNGSSLFSSTCCSSGVRVTSCYASSNRVISTVRLPVDLCIGLCSQTRSVRSVRRSSTCSSELVCWSPTMT